MIRTRFSFNAQPRSCTTAVLASFGVDTPSRISRTPKEVCHLLKVAGHGVVKMPNNWTVRGRAPTLGQFMKEYPRGDFYLVTCRRCRNYWRDGHSMSLRDGCLTDTDLQRGPNRHIILAYRVTRI